MKHLWSPEHWLGTTGLEFIELTVGKKGKVIFSFKIFQLLISTLHITKN